jgi:hypothetical protein
MNFSSPHRYITAGQGSSFNNATITGRRRIQILNCNFVLRPASHARSRKPAEKHCCGILAIFEDEAVRRLECRDFRRDGTAWHMKRLK